MEQTDRKSLVTTMEERYAKGTCGGAFDAKAAGKVTADGFSNDFADGFTKGGKDTGLPKKESMFLKGHSNKKYKG
jgi:hypothetical protein